jgi:hypothetical protein
MTKSQAKSEDKVQLCVQAASVAPMELRSVCSPSLGTQEESCFINYKPFHFLQVFDERFGDAATRWTQHSAFMSSWSSFPEG